MEVVVHQGEGVKDDGVGAEVVGELAEHALSVGVGPEDVLPAVAAAGHVVEPVAQVDAGWSGHTGKIPRGTRPVKRP